MNNKVLMMKQQSLWLLLIIIGLSIGQSMAQNAICTGNIGDNIFEQGDFGAGTANNVSNPTITTTYSYNAQGPPNDGSYTITNDMGAWPNRFDAWLPARDNSSDPNGYFMVVNADFSTGIFYEEIIDGLCENTLYVFSADILNVVSRPTPNHTLPDVSFLLDATVQFSTGPINQDEQWNTYGFTFVTGPTTTSMKLSLRNNAPGGFGNDLGLDNITFRPCGPTAEILPFETANICEDGDPITINATITGDQFATNNIQWQQSFDGGITWQNIEGEQGINFQHTETTAGFYYYRYLLASSRENIDNTKCRVNSNTKVIQVIPKFFEIDREICEGLSFSLGDSIYSSSGNYTNAFISSIGCDSIVTLNLTVTPNNGLIAEVEGEHPTCTDSNDGFINIQNIANGRPPYTIQVNGETISGATVFPNLEEGDYDLAIADSIGCAYQETIQLLDPPPFTIHLGERLTVDLGAEVTLVPESTFPIAQYIWSPQLNDCDNCTAQSFIPTNSQFYRLTALNNAGCVAVDSIFITVLPTRQVYIPNVFSPNDDGIHDYFSIFAMMPSTQLISEIVIFDRWGNMVYEAQNILPESAGDLWDGRYNGQLVDAGIYVYSAKILFLDGKEEVISGDVMVIR